MKSILNHSLNWICTKVCYQRSNIQWPDFQYLFQYGNQFQILTFAEPLFHQLEASGTQTLITNLQVITDVRATTVVVKTLVRICEFKRSQIVAQIGLRSETLSRRSRSTKAIGLFECRGTYRILAMAHRTNLYSHVYCCKLFPCRCTHRCGT